MLFLPIAVPGGGEETNGGEEMREKAHFSMIEVRGGRRAVRFGRLILLIGWLIGWLVVDYLVGWLGGWVGGYLVGWLVGCLVARFLVD